MAKTSTLGSPGIEVNEVDNSVRVSTSTACTVLVTGFASLGPVEEISSIGSIDDFETMYGTPTNAAERYFYHSVKTLALNSGPGTHILTSRLPYGAGEGDNISSSYTLLAYPAIPVVKKGDTGHDQYLMDEGKFIHALSIEAHDNDGYTNTHNVYKIKNVKTKALAGEHVKDGLSFGKDDYTISFESNAYVYKIIGGEVTDEKTINALKAKIDELSSAKSGIYEIKSGTTVITYAVKVEESNLTVYVVNSIPVSEFSDIYNANKNLTGTIAKRDGTVIFSDDKLYAFVRSSTAPESGYPISGTDVVTVTWNVVSATETEIESVYNTIKTTQVTTNITDAKHDGPGNFYLCDADENSYFTQGPQSVSYDLVIENGTLPDNSLIVNKFIVGEDNTNIPTYGEDDTVNLEWKISPEAEVSFFKAQGRISTERVGKDTILNISIPVIKQSNSSAERDSLNATQIGVLRVTATYADLEVKGSGHSEAPNWKFVLTDSSITATVAKAYEILESSFKYKDASGAVDETKSITYVIGSPVAYNIPASEYNAIATGEAFSWGDEPIKMFASDTYNKYESIKNAAFIVINKSRTTVNEGHEGYYLGVSDNMFVSPSDDYVYNAIEAVKGTTKVYNYNGGTDAVGIVDKDYDEITKNRLNFHLDSNYQGSVSRIMERGITKFDMSSTDYDDTLNIGLFKLNKASTALDALKLSYSLHEGYNASFGASRQKTTVSSSKAISYFVENEMEDSSNITIFVNPNISSSIKLDADGNLLGKMRVYGTKLIDNLNFFEKKYLIDSFNKSKTQTTYDTAIAPMRLAKQCIDSYSSLMDLAGLTTAILKEIGEKYTSFNENSALYQFGTYQETAKSNKQIIGNVPAKLERALDLISNDEEYPNVDIIIEAGLGTIYAYSNGASVIGESTSLMTESETSTQTTVDEDAIKKQTNFVDSVILQGVEDLRTGQTALSDEAQAVVEDYIAVQNAFLKIANALVSGGRGDTYYIPDVLRGILIKGKDTKIVKLFGGELVNSVYSKNDQVKHSWSTSVYYPIKHLFDNITSNYLSAYCQWFKVVDEFSGEKCWIPASSKVAALMGVADANNGPWSAAAGINRGIIQDVLDYAISPTLSQRTDLYNICVNSIPKIPNVGLCVWGIRTMGRKDSAFDQNTCRRTFLYLEKVIKRYLRNYIFEQNTTYTRLLIVNDLEPLLESVMNAGGIYSYTITCDTTNNTPEIINNGDLAVDISAAPTRTAENIVLTMVANKYTNVVTTSSTLS